MKKMKHERKCRNKIIIITIIFIIIKKIKKNSSFVAPEANKTFEF